MNAALAGPSLPVLGGRVCLTALRERDIDRIVEACSTDDARRFMDTPWPYGRSDAEGFVREFAPAGWRGEHDERVWAIRESLRGPLVGVVGLRGERTEVGYWLHPDARGRGLMADALRTLVGHAEGCLTWPEVHWRCFDGNVASMRVARAAGFSYLGTADVDDPDDRGDGPRRIEHRAVRVAGGMPADARPWPELD